MMIWAGTCSTHGTDNKCIQNLGKLEGKRPLEELGLCGRTILDVSYGNRVDWMHLA
jgi:hypothetical protein